MCALAERLSQSEIELPLRKICYYSPLAEVGVSTQTEMNTKADTPKSAYPLNIQYKKYCIRCIPTLALSKSGYGSRPLSLLSACCRQAPHLFSCQVSQNNSCKTYGQLLSDVSSQTLSLTDDIIALHFFNCNISFRIFRIVLEWCYLKQITAWGYKIYYLGEITL